MRLTALCVHGTLLAFLSLSWTIVDSGEGDIVGAKGFGPCAATLQSEGLCREGQDESTCPYLFSLPPLTVHLPKQLGELEKIMKDLQKLKDNVDQLRKMCADCTVSQTERECGRQFEREHVKLNGGSDAHEDESNWVNERNFRQECGTDGVRVENTMEGDGNTDSEKGTILEEQERKKWEAERESDKGAVKENEKAETLKKVAENDGKTQTEGAKGKDKLGQLEKPSAGGNERIVDTMREKVAEKNNRDTGREIDKEKDRKWDWKGDRDEKLENGKERETATHTKIKEKTEESDHHVRGDETKETDKKTRTEEDRDSDGTKMSEDHSKHTNKEQEQPKKDRKKKTEKTIKVEQNNEKLKQTESIRRAGKETTVKEGEEEEEGRETGRRLKPEGGKMVQSVLRDSDGELTSNKATETTDFVSVSPTPQSSLSLAPEPDSMNSNTGTISTSSPPLSGSHLFTDANQGMIMPANGPPTPSTGDEETGLRVISRPTTTTSATFILTSTTSPRPGADFKDQVSSTTASTTTITKSQTLNTTAFLGERDGSRWTAKKNISSNTKMVMKPLPGLEGKLGETHEPGINPERDQNLKTPQNDRKQTKPNQKQRPSHPKPPSDQKPKSGKGPQQVHIPKPEQRAPPDNLTTDQNLTNKTNKLISKHDQKLTTEPNNLIDQQPKSHQTSIPAVQRPTSNQRAVSVNTTVSGTDPESAEIPKGNQNSKPEKRVRRPLQTNKPNQKQKPEKKPKSEEKTKHDQRSELKQYFTPVQESESESETQTFVTELMGNSDENPSPEPKSDIDSTAGEKPTLDRIDLPPDQKPEPSQEIPTLNQTPTHGHVAKHDQKPQEPTTDQRIKTNVKPKPGKLPQTNQGLKTPWPGQLPKLNPKSVPDQIPEVDSDKTPKPRPPPAHRPPNRPTFKPGATSVQRLKPAVQLRPSSKTKTDLEPHISGTTSDGIQNSQTGMSPTSGPIKQTAVTPGAKTSSSQETQSFPLLDTLPQGFTMNPNSRTTSDLRPQTAGQPSSIPMTTRPNKISRGILPSVMPSTSPGPTKLNLAPNTDTSLQEQIVNNVEETAAPTQTSDSGKMTIPVTSPSPQTTSTLSPDFRSTTPAASGLKPPAAESPTPSTRELRVKINQVAAFLNNSLNPNGPSLDRRPKEHREYSQGGSRPDPRLPTHIPVKVTAVKRDCSDHLHQGQTKSGVYLVTPDIRSKSFPVFCDMELDGGGWTLLQRRQDGSVSFNRTWAEYRSGFGELDGGEFWLGNNMIHLLTRDRDMTLRVELEDFDGVMEYAEYRQFKVASERLRYRLTVGGYSGTAGDALRFSKSYDHNNRPFTTPDKDNDRYPSGNCGAYYSSGWWFDACMAANLNGRYYVGKYTGVRDGIFWGTWHNISTEYYPTSDRRSFKRVRMMIRPKGLAPGL